MTQNTPLPHGLEATRESACEPRYMRSGSSEAALCGFHTICASVLQDAPYRVMRGPWESA
jgi:hypothetical protein